MKRSESILVWAVTAIVGVIVLVAVIFGREDSDALAGQRGKKDVQELIAGGGDPLSFTDAKGMPEGGAGPDGKTNGGEGADARQPSDSGEGKQPVTDPDPATPAHAMELRSLLGEFRLEGQPDGSKYRVVTARFGDSFGELVQKWTGSAGAVDEVRALNEGLVPERLRSGEEIWFPWVDDQILVEAFQARRGSGRESTGAVPPRGSDLGAVANLPGNQPVPTPPTGGGEWRTVKPGESLWKIAADAVGQRRAQAYIDEILRLNPSIHDAGQIKAGDRVMMPRR